MTTDAEIAWAAGLFEGEGSWGVYRRPRHDRGTERTIIQATLGMTDRDVVERFARIVGMGSVQAPRRNGNRSNRKLIHTWAVADARSVQRLIEMFRPWLGARRLERAEAVIRASVGIKPHNKDRTHCPKGHPYSGDNLILSVIQRAGRPPATVRRCKTCRVPQWREQQRKRLGITPDRYRVG